jgi:transposase
MKATYEQLELALSQTKAELSQTKALLKQAFEIIDILKKEVEELKAKLNKNSKNSSKPPSSDHKGNTKEGDKKPKKKREGSHRPLFPKDRVDKTIKCCHKQCPCCGSESLAVTGVLDVIHQIELPEVRAIVTEYILQKTRCNSCDHASFPNLPDGVPYSTFGPKLMGLLAALTGAFHLAKREAIQLIKDLYDIDISVGSVPNIEERVSKALDPTYQVIHDFVLESHFTKHFDETTWRDQGKRHYVWIASCEKAAFYMIDRYRNKLAFQKLLKNKNLQDKGSVSDRYAVYKELGKHHQYCLAHLIRDFKAYGEREGPDKKIGKALEKILAKACSAHRKHKEGKISLSQRNRRLVHARKKAEYWLYEGLANGSDKLSSLCNRLLDEFDKLWTFVKHLHIDPTNNMGERDLRKMVIWRKKSYGTRSSRGKRFVERITTIVQTLRKKKKNVLKYIQQSLISFYRGEKAPQICSEMGF